MLRKEDERIEEEEDDSILVLVIGNLGFRYKGNKGFEENVDLRR